MSMFKVNDPGNALSQLQHHLNDAMLKAAEPIIQKALQDIEREMREKLAQKVIALLRNDWSVDRLGSDLRIVVHQALKERG